MYKKLIPLIIILLLISGCGTKEKPGEPEKLEIHKGTDGLVMKFLENLPPDEVWKDSEFTIGLELQNKGAYTISGGIIVITGFDPLYINLKQDQASFDLEGKNINYPEGGYKILNLEAKNINFPKGKEEMISSFTARAYYDYETEAPAEVCINPDIYSYVKTEEVGCEVKTITLSGGQGAPVAVTRIEELISPISDSDNMEVEFKIYIVNKGKGDVVGNVNVKEVELAGRRIKCYPTEINLEERGEKATICRTSVERTQGAYITPIVTRLSYAYTQKQDKILRIKALSS
jgi:hypothetical protein